MYAIKMYSTDMFAQVLEKLYRAKWSSVFGVGALVISPTRELAYQIFEVLRKVCTAPHSI